MFTRTWSFILAAAWLVAAFPARAGTPSDPMAPATGAASAPKETAAGAEQARPGACTCAPAATEGAPAGEKGFPPFTNAPRDESLG